MIFAGSRRRRQAVVGGSANQHESRKRSGRSHPVQHNAASTTPYRPQGAQTVQHDENDDYYHSQGGPPPPAYDADVKDAYFSVSGNYNPTIISSYLSLCSQQSSGNGNGIEGQMASDIAYNPVRLQTGVLM